MPDDIVVEGDYLIPRDEETTDEDGNTTIVGYPPDGVVVDEDVQVGPGEGEGSEPPG